MLPRTAFSCRTLRRFAGAFAAVCLLPACDPVDDPAAAAPPKFKAPPPEPRRTDSPSRDTAQWLTAWRELREQLAPLEEKLGSMQQLHMENHFDSFLGLNPETLGKDQLCSIFHFLERGYFTVERQILLHLLQRRAARGEEGTLSIPVEGGGRLRDRIIAAMQRDELRIVDLETAIEFYSRSGVADIPIPQSMSQEELGELRAAVTGMMDETREKIIAMDAEIAGLRAKLFGGPVEIPPPPPSPQRETPAEPAEEVAVPEEGLFPMEDVPAEDATTVDDLPLPQ